MTDDRFMSYVNSDHQVATRFLNEVHECGQHIAEGFLPPNIRASILSVKNGAYTFAPETVGQPSKILKDEANFRELDFERVRALDFDPSLSQLTLVSNLRVVRDCVSQRAP